VRTLQAVGLFFLVTGACGLLAAAAAYVFSGPERECYARCSAHGYILVHVIHTGQCVCVDAIDIETLEKP